MVDVTLAELQGLALNLHEQYVKLLLIRWNYSTVSILLKLDEIGILLHVQQKGEVEITLLLSFAIAEVIFCFERTGDLS